MLKKEVFYISFSIRDALGKGWEVAKENLGFLIGAFFVAVIFSIMTQAINGVFNLLFPEPTLLIALIQVVVALVFMTIQFTISLGFIKISLNLYKGEEVNFKMLFSQYDLIFSFLFASILYSVSVILGSLLLIIPGLILMLQFMFYPFVLVEQRTGAIDALKESSRITKGEKGKLFLFHLALVFINMVATIPLGLGLFISIPVTNLAITHVYNQLTYQPEEEVITEEVVA